MRFVCPAEKRIETQINPSSQAPQSIKEEQTENSPPEFSVKQIEERVVGLKKINPSKPKELDVDFFIDEFKKIEGTPRNQSKAKQKLKYDKEKQQKLSKSYPEAPEIKLSQFSIDLIKSFKTILEQKFQPPLTQLGQDRKQDMEKLFKYLCYGLEELMQSSKKPGGQSEKIFEIDKGDFIILLKDRVFRIDEGLLNAHSYRKKTQVSLKFRNQWNFILEMTKDLGNTKFRLGIITNEIKPSKLVNANKVDLKKYLSVDIQKSLDKEAEKIVRFSSYEDMKLHFNESQESSKERSTDTDEKSIKTSENSKDVSITLSFKSKASSKRSKPKSHVSQDEKEKSAKKVRKLNEKLSK